MAEQKKALESIWLIRVLLQVRRELRPQESPDELDGTWRARHRARMATSTPARPLGLLHYATWSLGWRGSTERMRNRKK